VALADGQGLEVEAKQIAAARRCKWSVMLTAQRPVPRDWLPSTIDVASLVGRFPAIN